jgi:hypothetical protein
MSDPAAASCAVRGGREDAGKAAGGRIRARGSKVAGSRVLTARRPALAIHSAMREQASSLTRPACYAPVGQTRWRVEIRFGQAWARFGIGGGS